MDRSFYRLIRSNPSTLDDYLSNKAKGIPMARPDPEVALLWDGISVYATENQARNQAKGKPWLGSHIAEIVISDRDPVQFRRTGTGRGHHTLWGEAAQLRARERRIMDV